MKTENVLSDKTGIRQLIFEIFSGQRHPVGMKSGTVSGGKEKRLPSMEPEQAQKLYGNDYNPKTDDKSTAFLGYEGIGPETGIFIDKDHALEYAIWRGLCGTWEDQEAFAEELRIAALNMYTGNWIERWSEADE